MGGIPELLETVRTGDDVLVNGSEGIAEINPNSQALKRYEKSLDEEQKRVEEIAQISSIGRMVTLDEIEVSVMANVRNREDVENAMKRGADGIGVISNRAFLSGS